MKKWAIPSLFFIYFCLFKQTLQFLQQINVKKCPPSIWCWDLKPRSSEHESLPITTRPGLPAHSKLSFKSFVLSLTFLLS